MSKEEEEVETEESWISKFNSSVSSEYPIDLNIGRMTTKILRPLYWCNYEIQPMKMKLTNTGKTVILSAKWRKEDLSLAGGPFPSRQSFSQIHFHWGRNGMTGSAHSVDGESLPMELHAVHFKSDYENHETAARKFDGISIVVIFFKSAENPKIGEIVKSLKFVKQVQTSFGIVPFPISNLLGSFSDDYFLYRGSILTNNSRRGVTWLISRKPAGISIEQIAEFRTLDNANSESLGEKKFQTLDQVTTRIAYHVNPSGSMYSSLFPIWRSLTPSGINNCTGYFEDGNEFEQES